jgi:hypothetical protein
MSSQWSSADPRRRRLFLVGMAAIVAILGWIGYEYLTADTPGTSGAGRPTSTVAIRTPPPRSFITVPPEHQDDDDHTPPPPARSQEPVRIPPRYTQPPVLPLADADLKAANDQAMAFLEVFANGRWDDKPEDRVKAIRAFVPDASIDVVLAQYERIRAKESTHEAVTFRVTGAKWVSLSDRQVTVLITGERRIVDDTGDRTTARAFVLTLVRGGGGWKVASARDPAEGDVGMGTR